MSTTATSTISSLQSFGILGNASLAGMCASAFVLPGRMDAAPEVATPGGRCISGTHVAHPSCRVQDIRMAIGAGFGTVAAIALNDCVAPADVDIAKVRNGKHFVRQKIRWRKTSAAHPYF